MRTGHELEEAIVVPCVEEESRLYILEYKVDTNGALIQRESLKNEVINNNQYLSSSPSVHPSLSPSICHIFTGGLLGTGAIVGAKDAERKVTD